MYKLSYKLNLNYKNFPTYYNKYEIQFVNNLNTEYHIPPDIKLISEMWRIEKYKTQQEKDIYDSIATGLEYMFRIKIEKDK